MKCKKGNVIEESIILPRTKIYNNIFPDNWFKNELLTLKIWEINLFSIFKEGHVTITFFKIIISVVH